MHTSAGSGEPTDESRLLADRAHWGLREVVDLAGQQTSHAAGEEQGQIGCRVVRLRAGLSEGGDQNKHRLWVEPAQTGGIVPLSPKILRPTFTDDQVGRRERSRRVAGDDPLAVVEIIGERGRIVRVDADDIDADISKETPAHGGGQALADLDYAEPCQQ